MARTLPARSRPQRRALARLARARAQAELALHASESQLAAVVDATPDAIVTVDAAGTVVLVNQGASRLFGCTAAQALGAPLGRWLPQAHDYITRIDALGHGRPGVLARHLGLQAQREDGSALPVEASIARVRLDVGALYCLVVRDLRQQQAAEQAREELQVQLRQAQKMEALGTMAGGIAHDFNNIVAAILGNARLAREHGPLTAQALRHLGEIERAGQRARDLVQRILTFSRLPATDLPCLPLQPMVADAVPLLRAVLPDHVEVAYAEHGATAWVHADAVQVSQLLMNLGTNAGHAIGERTGHIAIDVGSDAGHAWLQVRDDGSGMDAVTLERIFEPFFTTKPKGEGTGLGLPVVHGIVRGLGGRIEVESAPGAGTTVRVLLPLADLPHGQALPPALPAPAAHGPEPEPARGPEPTPSPAPAAAPVAAGAGRHVVYLDDYEAMVALVQTVLEARGWRVTAFDDARRARTWLAAHVHEVDVVVSDQNMPGCSGVELARELHALRPALPVVLASGYVTEDLRREAAAAGVRQVFDKPGGIERLCELLAGLLGAPDTAAQEGA